MPVPVVVRRARELLVASTTLSIAAAAHLLAGGTLPATTLGWALAVAMTMPVAVWAGRRRLTLARVLPAMALLQVVQHSVLSFAAAAEEAARSGDGTAAAATSRAGAHAAHLALSPGSLAASSGASLHHHADGPAASSLMLLAHAGAVVVTALLLAAGDRAAATVVVWLGAVTLLVQGPPAFASSRQLGPVGGRPWVPHSRSHLAAARLRGPPGGLPALA